MVRVVNHVVIALFALSIRTKDYYAIKFQYDRRVKYYSHTIRSHI